MICWYITILFYNTYFFFSMFIYLWDFSYLIYQIFYSSRVCTLVVLLYKIDLEWNIAVTEISKSSCTFGTLQCFRPAFSIYFFFFFTSCLLTDPLFPVPFPFHRPDYSYTWVHLYFALVCRLLVVFVFMYMYKYLCFWGGLDFFKKMCATFRRCQSFFFFQNIFRTWFLHFGGVTFSENWGDSPTVIPQ